MFNKLYIREQQRTIITNECNSNPVRYHDTANFREIFHTYSEIRRIRTTDLYYIPAQYIQLSDTYEKHWNASYISLTNLVCAGQVTFFTLVATSCPVLLFLWLLTVQSCVLFRTISYDPCEYRLVSIRQLGC